MRLNNILNNFINCVVNGINKCRIMLFPHLPALSVIHAPQKLRQTGMMMIRRALLLSSRCFNVNLGLISDIVVVCRNNVAISSRVSSMVSGCCGQHLWHCGLPRHQTPSGLG